MAQSLGIGCQIMSVFSGNAVETQVADPQNARAPQDRFAARLGYPMATAFQYVRVRRDVADFAHHNRFGARLDPHD